MHSHFTHQRRKWLITGCALAAILSALILVVPKLLYPPLSGKELATVTTSEKKIELATAQRKLQNDARAVLLQAVGGSVLLLGAVFTWIQIGINREQLDRNAEATRKQLEATAEQVRLTGEQLELDRQTQITERFAHAIEHLDSAAHGTDVTLAGLYELGRIAGDSRADRATIGEVLTGYLRGHSPWPPSLARQPPAGTPLHEVPALKTRAPDVQVALSVLGRGEFPPMYVPTEGLDLSATDLRRARLRTAVAGGSGAHFEYAYFSDACLDGADLSEGHFEWANFARARLKYVNLTSAYLDHAHLLGAIFGSASVADEIEVVGKKIGVAGGNQGCVAELGSAHLDGADLRGTDLRKVNLSFAFLVDALLYGADLSGAILCGASLHGAKLVTAQLEGAALNGAYCDLETTWPPDFDWEGRGVTISDRPVNPRSHAVRFSGLQDDFKTSMSSEDLDEQ